MEARACLLFDFFQRYPFSTPHHHLDLFIDLKVCCPSYHCRSIRQLIRLRLILALALAFVSRGQYCTAIYHPTPFSTFLLVLPILFTRPCGLSPLLVCSCPCVIFPVSYILDSSFPLPMAVAIAVVSSTSFLWLL
ncbi:hypothetical protein HDK77DRAFT_116774 [Phyllosticta capitalensis]